MDELLEFDPFEIEEVRLQALPDSIRDGLKTARKRARENGGKIPMVKMIGGRGESVFVMTVRDFQDGRKIDRLHQEFIESLLLRLVGRETRKEKGR